MTDHTDHEWPREIWAFAIDQTEFEVSGTYVTSEHATLPRWEGDEERERPEQRYVDADIYDSADRYWRERCKAQAARIAELEAAQAGVWGQYATTAGPFKEQAMAARESGAKWDFDTTHDVSEVTPDGTRRKVGTFRHASDAEEAERAVNGVRSGALVPAQDVAEAERRGAEQMRARAANVADSFIGHDARAEGALDAGEGFDLACDNIASAIRALPLPPAPQEGE